MTNRWLLASGIFLGTSAFTLAVTTAITRHHKADDFTDGQAEQVVIDSAGTLRLARQAEAVDCGDLLKDVWSVHSMLIAPDDTLFLGTGPNARVVRVDKAGAREIYPLSSNNDPNDASGRSIRNEHVFAMGLDVAGRLLLGISGQQGKLIRLDEEPEVVFEDERVKFIFAMAVDQQRNIYLGTGPEGLIWRLDPFAKNPEVIYDAKDKNILSLAIRNGQVYAGSDERGVIYRIDPDTGGATILYDTNQDEVPAILVEESGTVYAVSTSAQAAQAQLKASGISLKKQPGRPDSSDETKETPAAESLETANTDKDKEAKKEKKAPEAPAPPAAKVAGHIYRITPDGFVKDIFSEIAVLYSLVKVEDTLWLGTGSKGQLFSIDPETEQKSIAFEDTTSSQITCAVAGSNGSIYLGLSNPARLVQMEQVLAAQGTFESELIDAGQPARWGKLQIEADIPEGCQVQMSCRSGNVKDPNDPTFSEWSKPVLLTEATLLDCPIGRFCQYRLTLSAGPEQHQTPVVRQVSVAHVIPNLAPNVTAIKADRSRDKEKPYLIEISFVVKDSNKDTLEYALEFRKAGRTGWIPLKDELDKPQYKWDGRTVEDGRYEVRVTANDRKSNTPQTTLTGSRISDVFVIDNTAPKLTKADLTVEGSNILADLVVEDGYSVLGSVRYTVNSNEKWITALPDDLVYDTLSETFSIRIEDFSAGDHVIAFSVADDLGNTRYQTYEVTIP